MHIGDKIIRLAEEFEKTEGEPLRPLQAIKHSLGAHVEKQDPDCNICRALEELNKRRHLPCHVGLKRYVYNRIGERILCEVVSEFLSPMNVWFDVLEAMEGGEFVVMRKLRNEDYF